MLSAKQKRFVDEYLIDLNAKQAAIRAGYSPHSAEFQGSKLLALDKVSQEIKIKQDIIAKEFKVTREDLIKDLIAIKNSQIKEFPPTSINAIKEIAKLLGLYEPDKVEHSGEIKFFDLKIPGLENDTTKDTD
jgi:phage terminase small subunit